MPLFDTGVKLNIVQTFLIIICVVYFILSCAYTFLLLYTRFIYLEYLAFLTLLLINLLFTFVAVVRRLQCLLIVAGCANCCFASVISVFCLIDPRYVWVLVSLVVLIALLFLYLSLLQKKRREEDAEMMSASLPSICYSRAYHTGMVNVFLSPPVQLHITPPPGEVEDHQREFEGRSSPSSLVIPPPNPPPYDAIVHKNNRYSVC